MAHPKHQQVRARYHFCCGYCGVSEIDAGGELTVDHYIPVSAGGDESDANLVYACARCNLYKSDFQPDGASEASLRVLHPERDDADEHFQLDEQSGLLKPLTALGDFHLTLLRLNRPQLVHRRLERALRVRMAERMELLIDEGRRQAEVIQAQANLIDGLKRLAGDVSSEPS